MDETLIKEVIILVVPPYGYLPTIKIGGKEVYRGEYQTTLEGAVLKIKSRPEMM